MVDSTPPVYRFGDWTLEPALNRLSRAGESHQLEARSMDVLAYLVVNHHRVVPADELLEHFWPGRIVEQSTIHRRINQIRGALGDDPRQPAYIRTIVKRGYQAIAHVEQVSSPGESLDGHGTPGHATDGAWLNGAERSSERPASRRRGLLAVAGSVVAVAGLLMVPAVVQRFSADAPNLPVQQRALNPAASVAVLPFEDFSAAENDNYLAEAFRAEIGSKLSRFEDLRVISPTAVDRAIAQGLERERVGPALGAGHEIRGRFRAEGERLWVSVELNEVANESLLWAETYEQDLDELFDVQRDIAAAVVRVLGSQVAAEEMARLEGGETNDLDAFRLLQKARSVPVTSAFGMELLEEAVALDPAYAEAHAELAWWHVWKFATGQSADLDVALRYADRALELDPQLGWAHYVKGFALWTGNRLHPAARHLRKAATLAPSNRVVLEDLSGFLAMTGHLEESLEFGYRAYLLEPNDTNTRWHLALPLLALDFRQEAREWLVRALDEYRMHDLDYTMGRVGRERVKWLLALMEAIDGEPAALRRRSQETLQKAPSDLDREPSVPELSAATMLVLIGDGEDVRARLEAWHEQRPDARFLGFPPVRVLLGHLLWPENPQRASLLLDETIATRLQRIDAGEDAPVLALDIARCYAVMGDRAMALDWLKRAYAAGERSYRRLLFEPFFKSLHGNRGFDTVIENMRQDVIRMKANVERDGLADVVLGVIARG